MDKANSSIDELDIDPPSTRVQLVKHPKITGFTFVLATLEGLVKLKNMNVSYNLAYRYGLAMDWT
jgi:hypothetical protein